MKGRVASRQNAPLISPTTELDLIEFLKPYRRLRAEKVCTQPVDSSQVTVWTFKGGAWTRGVPNRTAHTGSWCQSYLTTALNLSRSEYDQAKKELFSQASGLNGLYQHKSQYLYAIVYRPQTWLNKRNIAAIAGGTALVGLGVAGTRYALRNPQAQASLKVPPGSKPPSTSQDLETRISEYDKKLGDVLKNAETEKPSAQDFTDLSTYTDLLGKYEDPIKAKELRKKVIMFESLLAMDASRKTLHDLFGEDRDEIVQSEQFIKHGDAISRYFEAAGDVDRLNTYRTAKIYKRMKLHLKQEDEVGFLADLGEMFQLYRTCSVDTAFLPRLKSHSLSRTFQKCVQRFRDNERKDEEDADALNSIIPVLQDALNDANEIPILDTQRIVSLAGIKCRSEFFRDLRYAEGDHRWPETYKLARKADMLYDRVVALQNLEQSQSKTIDDVAELNRSYKMQDGLDGSKQNAYVRKFVESWEHDRETPEGIKKLFENIDQSEMYKTVFEALRAGRLDKIPSYFKGDDYVQAGTQLREDLRTNEFGADSDGKIDALLKERGYA